MPSRHVLTAPPPPAALAGPCYVLSDAHIGATHGDVEVRVLQFIESLHGRAASLVINGDLLDFWFEWRHVVPRSGYRVVAALSSLARSGTVVLWIAGNHDCWGADVLRDAGIIYMEGAWQGTIAGWRARVEHGDGLRGAEDRGYRLLRHLLRNRLAVGVFRIVHPDWGTALARGSAHASRTYRAPDEGIGLRNVAMRLLAADATLDLVIFGHSHVAALERGEHHGVYANAGEWLVEPTYLRIDNERIELLRWRPDGNETLREHTRSIAVRT
ncbi:MAG: UDP-2,3-diacylglucosamine diphosphatase [Gemmatimonadaceae bacterium]